MQSIEWRRKIPQSNIGGKNRRIKRYSLLLIAIAKALVVSLGKVRRFYFSALPKEEGLYAPPDNQPFQKISELQ